MNRFPVQLFILTFIAATGIWAWNSYSPEQKHLNDLWFIPAFFVTITLVIHYILVGRSNEKPVAFVRNYMGITGIKLFACIFTIVIYGMFRRDHAVVFIMGFLIHYILFTAFEVIILLKYFRQNNSN